MEVDKLAGSSRAVKHRLHRGRRLTLPVESVAAGGAGVSKHDGMPIFIDRTVPGDVVEAEVYDARKSFAYAQAVRILEPSPYRVEPGCKLFKVCGGCQWQHIDYRAQLDYKEDLVRQAVKHIAGLNPDIVLPAIGAADPFFYRNKVQFPVGNPRDSRRLLAGYYRTNSHELVNIKHCPVQPDAFDGLLACVKQLAEKYGVAAYTENTGRGLLRHISMRRASCDETSLLTLVLNLPSHEKVPEKIVKLAQEVTSARPEVVGVCVNFNNERGNRIYGSLTKTISGRGYIVEKLRSRLKDAPRSLLDGVSFRLSPTSFFQVNSAQAVSLLDHVLSVAREKHPAPVVLDAYAGVGTIALWLAPLASQAVAVEEHAGAVADAKAGARLNGLQNVEFRQGTVEKVFPELALGGFKPDVLVLDPPRKGVSRGALEQAIKFKPSRMIYVSCNPATLARDLQLLSENGYQAVSVQPVDMFPQTFHVETVAVVDLIE